MCPSIGCWDLSGVVMGGLGSVFCGSWHISAVGGMSPGLSGRLLLENCLLRVTPLSGGRAQKER